MSDSRAVIRGRGSPDGFCDSRFFLDEGIGVFGSVGISGKEALK